MSNLIQINSKTILAKEFQGKRVVTFRDIDEVHNRTDGTSRRNFNDNKKHFIWGEDYFVRNSYEAQNEFGITAPNGLILLTESGYLMLVKSFTDALAWKVQRQLVNSYFRAKDIHNASSIELVKMINQQVGMLADEISVVSTKVIQLDEKVDNEIRVTYNQANEIQKSVSSRVIELLGGKESKDYKNHKGSYFSQLHRDLKDRLGVPSYRDIRKVDFDAALAYVKAWLPKAEDRQAY